MWRRSLSWLLLLSKPRKTLVRARLVSERTYEGPNILRNIARGGCVPCVCITQAMRSWPPCVIPTAIWSCSIQRPYEFVLQRIWECELPPQLHWEPTVTGRASLPQYSVTKAVRRYRICHVAQRRPNGIGQLTGRAAGLSLLPSARNATRRRVHCQSGNAVFIAQNGGAKLFTERVAIETLGSVASDGKPGRLQFAATRLHHPAQ